MMHCFEDIALKRYADAAKNALILGFLYNLEVLLLSVI